MPTSRSASPNPRVRAGAPYATGIAPFAPLQNADGSPIYRPSTPGYGAGRIPERVGPLPSGPSQGQLAQLASMGSQVEQLPQFARALRDYQRALQMRRGAEVDGLQQAARQFDQANRAVLMDKLRRSQIYRPEQRPLYETLNRTRGRASYDGTN